MWRFRPCRESIIKQNGTIIPYNDYDLLLVAKKRISKNKLGKLSKSLADEIGIRFIDLGATKEFSLSKIPITIFSYDLKNSIVLFGNKKIMDKINSFRSKKIPIE